MKNSKALRTLTVLAMALPGISKGLAQDSNSAKDSGLAQGPGLSQDLGLTPGAAQSPILKPQADLSHTYYNEGKDRYRINISHLTLGFPLKEGVADLTINALRDVMSGASSHAYMPGTRLIPPRPIEEAGELNTAPSISETRDDVSVAGRYFFKDSNVKNVGLQVGYSTENDYKSFYGNLGLAFEFNKKNTGVNLEAGVARDSISPVTNSYPLFLPHRIPALIGHKTTQKYLVSLRQDLTPKSYVQQGIGFNYDKGLLDDPYKTTTMWGDATAGRPGARYLIPLTGEDLTVDYDRRPSTKSTWLFTTRYVQYVEPFDSSVHFDYRYGTNSWSVNSHTFRLAYHQPFGEGWEIAPSIEYYTQNRAKFYGPLFTTKPGAPWPAKPLAPGAPATSDYRLASYGSFRGEVQISKVFLENYKATFIYGYIGRDPARGWSTDEIKRPFNKYNAKYASLKISAIL